MTTREKFAKELALKEERISAWESYGVSYGLFDKEQSSAEIPDYWDDE